MNTVEIAKNLLAGRVCNSCRWSNSLDKRIYITSDKLKDIKVLQCEFARVYPKSVYGSDTCVLWNDKIQVEGARLIYFPNDS